ncbi:hypothetical protein [Sinomonas sp. ASV322]|uniref:hypothetical protein n=1 Tax=Sinomonas sp. ASV322 TaxID=3041920 RepID=UPI0027DD603D|nr:hypothetical protein [Sinomonas sp. ASV322]MDQ4503881.1 hypothetical protein [Sinomonas sp. ASV322]
MDLAAVAAELYGLPIGEFTSARNDQAKAARSEGNPLLAKQIAKLSKPSMAAWAVNMLARHRPGTLEGVLGLGASLRHAQDERDPDALRRLGQDRQKVLAGAVADVRAAAGECGAAISNAAAVDVEQTLRAAMADPEAGLAAASGQLVRALSSNGIDPVDLSGAVAVPGALAVPGATAVRRATAVRGATAVPGAAAVSSAGAAAPDVAVQETVGQNATPGAPESRGARGSEQPTAYREPDDEARRRAERERAAQARAQADADDAERAAERASADLAEAERRTSETRARRGELAARLRELRAQAADLEEELLGAERQTADAERSRKLAARLADQRRRVAQRARERLDDLPG